MNNVNQSESVKIEPMQRKYMAQVIGLLQQISEFFPRSDLYDEIWEEFHAQSNISAVVAVERELVVAYGLLVMEKKIRGGKMGHIEDIVTHPEKRNVGLGKLIVNELFDIATKNGCYKVSLQCRDNNVNFYEKCGYSVSGWAMQRFL